MNALFSSPYLSTQLHYLYKWNHSFARSLSGSGQTMSCVSRVQNSLISRNKYRLRATSNPSGTISGGITATHLFSSLTEFSWRSPTNRPGVTSPEI